MVTTGLFALPVTSIAQQKVVPLWPGTAPGSESWTQKEETIAVPQVAAGRPLVRNVTQPTLTAFLPNTANATGTAVIVCPGGGFQFLSWESEGTEIAEWFRARGVAAFVLKYRLIDTGPTTEDFQKSLAAFLALIQKLRTAPAAMRTGLPEPMQKIAPYAIADGLQAVKIVRQHATEWGIAQDRIGMVGLSTGAVVTLGAVMGQGSDDHPNFAGAIYGAGMDQFAASPEKVPLFILCADDDPIASTGSDALYAKWKTAGYAVELHIYAKGGHGFGMSNQGLPTDHWIERFGDWLKEQGLIRSPS